MNAQLTSMAEKNIIIIIVCHIQVHHPQEKNPDKEISVNLIQFVALP